MLTPKRLTAYEAGVRSHMKPRSRVQPRVSCVSRNLRSRGGPVKCMAVVDCGYESFVS